MSKKYIELRVIKNESLEKMSLCVGTLARKLRKCQSEKLMFEEN